MNIKVVGIGGIGSWLVRMLLHYLQTADPQATVTLIDGDSYEERNQARQIFRQCGNKAEVTAQELQVLYPKLCVLAEPVYVNSDNIAGLIYNGDVVFLCVDNHTSRKLVSDYAEDLADIAIFSGGNSLEECSAQVYVRRGGRNLHPPLASIYHPEITNPRDRHPEEQSCEELAQSRPQVVVANIDAAAALLKAFYVFVTKGSVNYADWYGDIVANSSRTAFRSVV